MSRFNLSYTHLHTAKLGLTFPVQLQEVLPGDKFRGSTQLFTRFAPMLAPIMHPIFCKIHHWFVPNRLLWDDWEDFITQGIDGLQSPDFPTIQADSTNGFTKGSLADYFGLPVGSAHKGIKVNALPFRAYQLIYNEWYRDEQLQVERDISFASGADTTTSTELFRAAWKKDYFTTARSETQLGASVAVPIGQLSGSTQTQYYGYKLTSNSSSVGVISGYTGSYIPSYLDFKGVPVFNADVANKTLTIIRSATMRVDDPSSSSSSYVSVTVTYNFSNLVFIQTDNQDSPVVTSANVDYSTKPNGLTVNATIKAGSVLGGYSDQISSVGAFEIRDLRLASSIQRYQERRLKYGNRYNEYLLSEWGINPQDSRLQLPEYVGGGRSFANISEVLQTAESTENPVGTMRGHGVNMTKSNRYRRRFPEHGWLITLCTYQPLPMYIQGLDKKWSRDSIFKYFTRELDAVGMEEVYQKELYATASNADVVFGYNDRYDSYRRNQNKVSGDFRDTLNFWHLARNFSSAPYLNSSFIECNPSDRIFAEQTTDHLWIYVQNSCSAIRKIPKRAKNILK